MHLWNVLCIAAGEAKHVHSFSWMKSHSNCFVVIGSQGKFVPISVCLPVLCIDVSLQTGERAYIERGLVYR